MRRHAVTLAGLSIALLACLAGPLRSETGKPEVPNVAEIKVELNGVFTRDPGSEADARPKSEQLVSMGLFAYGLPGRYVIRVEGGKVGLTTQDGKDLPLTPRFGPDAHSPLQVRALQAALGGIRLLAADEMKFDIVPLFTLPAELVAKRWNDSLRFSATLDFQLAEYTVTGSAAPKPGTFSGAGAPPARIVSVQNDRELTVRIDEGAAPKTAAGDRVYVLQNSRRKEAVLGKKAVLIETPLRANPPQTWLFYSSDTPSGSLLTSDWLAEAELVCLELRKVAAFTRSFSRDPFQLSFDIPGQSGKKSDYNAATLQEIQLPPSASREQMREYVRAIVKASRQQTVSGYEDPQVAMYKKLGAGNLDILIDEAPVPRTNKDLHIWKAMREMVDREHRDMVLSRLEAKPDVAELLQDREWIEKAKPILLKGLAAERNDLPSSWIEAVLSFRDPKTYPALTRYYQRNPGEPGLYEAIRILPGIDLRGIMPEAWATAKKGSVRQQSFVIHPACEWGVPDALATAADWLRPGTTDYQQRVAKRVFTEYTPARGSKEECLAWYETHKAGLVFDSDRKMFVPRS